MRWGQSSNQKQETTRMSGCKDWTVINSLRIHVGVSDDQNSIDDVCDIEDEKHHHVVKLSHRRYEPVDIRLKGFTRDWKLDFGHDGKRGKSWSCRLSIQPNYVSPDRTEVDRTKPRYQSATLCHSCNNTSEKLNTHIRHKLDRAPNWQNWPRSFSVMLR